MDENQHERSEKEKRSDLRLKLLTVVVIIALVLLALLTYAKYSEVPTVADVKKIVERSDCARQISNEQQIVKDDLSSASRALNILNAKGLVAVAKNDDAALSALIPQYEKALNNLEKQKDIVDKLPLIQDVVNKRCTNL